jgi:hypothetical protein
MPWAALFVLAAIVPLAALWLLERRSAAVRAALGGVSPRRGKLVLDVVAISVLVGLLAVALAQPVLVVKRTRAERTDAAAFVVVDTTRSMLAASGPTGANRFERARRIAEDVRDRLADIPVGLATITDRTLPNVFPTTDTTSFRAALEGAIGVERPPPGGYERVGTAFEALETVKKAAFFEPSTTKRLLIVLSDGETRPTALRLLAASLAGPPRITPLFVQVWKPNEHVYLNGVLDHGYVADAGSTAVLQRIAAATRGAVFAEGDVDGVVSTARKDLGNGETSAQTIGSRRVALTPWILAAAFVPLGFLLWRRNA